MKKIITLAIFLTSLISFNANAADPRFYFGLDYRLTDLNFTNGSVQDIALKSKDYYKTDFRGIAPFIGYQFNDAEALELSWFYNNSAKTNNNTGLYWQNGDSVVVKSIVSYALYSADYVRSYKLDNYPVTLLAIGGLSLIDLSVKEYYNNGNSSKDDSLKYGFNVGLGAELDITQDISLVTKVKYTKFMNTGLKKVYAASSLDSANVLSVGIKVKF